MTLCNLSTFPRWALEDLYNRICSGRHRSPEARDLMKTYGPWKLFFQKASRLACNLEIPHYPWGERDQRSMILYVKFCCPNILSRQCNSFPRALWVESWMASSITEVCSTVTGSCQCSGFNLQQLTTQNRPNIILSMRQPIWGTPRRGHWAVRGSWARPSVWNRRCCLIQVSRLADWASARGPAQLSPFPWWVPPWPPPSPSRLPSTSNPPDMNNSAFIHRLSYIPP